jgi:hypothetical protein
MFCQAVNKAQVFGGDADKCFMSTSAIGGSTSYLQQILASVLQATAATGSKSTTAGVTSASAADSTRLSPFAQLVGALQQLQQSDPAQYTKTTQQIATNLQSAAQTAQSQGNSAAAAQLTQLASNFTSASQTGQLPNLEDLAKAVSGGGHHHHHHAEESSGSTSSSSTSSGSTSSSSSSSALNPATIILNTLSAAGFGVSGS